MIDLDTLLTGGGGGIGGVVLGWFGIKTKLISIEKKVCKKQDKSACDAVKDGFEHRFDSIESLQKETRDDVKEILRRI